MTTRVTRIKGFQRPFSRDQITSWILQPLFVAAFIALTVSYLHDMMAFWILFPYFLLLGLFSLCWMICSDRNPASPLNYSKWFLSIPTKPTRYCTVCNKNSPGLDHHCTWLNTCIGDNNYESFVMLITIGSIMTSYQLIIGILMATTWFHHIVDVWHPGMNSSCFLVLLWFHNIVCFLLLMAYMCLTTFHYYLIYLRMGTYDYILKYGANHFCIRLLRCKCMTNSKLKAPKSPPPNEFHVNDGKTSKGNASVMHVTSNKPSLNDITEWKNEWMQKHGETTTNDDNEHTRARKVSVQNVHVELTEENAMSLNGSVIPLATTLRDPMDDINLYE